MTHNISCHSPQNANPLQWLWSFSLLDRHFLYWRKIKIIFIFIFVQNSCIKVKISIRIKYTTSISNTLPNKYDFDYRNNLFSTWCEYFLAFFFNIFISSWIVLKLPVANPIHSPAVAPCTSQVQLHCTYWTISWFW